MIHANAAGMEADVVLVFVAFVLSDTEQNSIFHLHPELSMFVFQHSFIFLLQQKQASYFHFTHNNLLESTKQVISKRMWVYLSVSLKSHQAMIDTEDDGEKTLGGLAVGFGLFLLTRSETHIRGRGVIVHVLLFWAAAIFCKNITAYVN